MGGVLVWGSNHTKVGLKAWQQSERNLLEMLELRGEDVTMNSLWGIELGILGACLDWEVAWERNVGLLLAVDLGPVDLGIGTGWGARGLQHIILLL